MEVDCAGCAGCCIDWRPLARDPSDHERRGPRPPLDTRYNFVPLTRDDVTTFVNAGYGDVMRPRLWQARDGDSQVCIDGTPVVAIDERPMFMMGLRHAPKPVAPFGGTPQWLSSCVFLDPTTLQCRIHDEPTYPRTCAVYPGQHLVMDVESECRRVEHETGQRRLLDATPPETLPPPPFGPQSLGATVFLHPDQARITGIVDRLQDDELTGADRAEFIAVAMAQSPGMPDVDDDRYQQALERLAAQTSWVGAARADWETAAGREDPVASLASIIEEDRGASPTAGWSNEST